MSFLSRVRALEVTAETRRGSYRSRVEAKYNIMEKVKQAAAKVLKMALPALVAFSASTGMAKVKDPEGLGKKFQDIVVDVAGAKSVVKTHVLQDDSDSPQVIVYTLSIDTAREDGKATIKYTEGETAKVNVLDSGELTSALAVQIKSVLDSIDSHAKQLAKKQGKAPTKMGRTSHNKLAENTKPISVRLGE
jgi:hypothetical protein